MVGNIDEGQADPPPYRLRLSSVRPERFKAAWKPSAVKLGDFNVIVGRNGSGKSTLLEALQWLDSAIRRDTREASERFRGVTDLINFRSRPRERPQYFLLDLYWEPVEDETGLEHVEYYLRIDDEEGAAMVGAERLTAKRVGRMLDWIVETTERGSRSIGAVDPAEPRVRVKDPDRLALARLSDTRLGDPLSDAVSDFWARAVFLRLSPNRLTEPSVGTRRSWEPILDEEGARLASLLFEFSPEDLDELAQDIEEVLPDIRGVQRDRAGTGREARVDYKLLERMPYVGRLGSKNVPVPAWMLSEGTRRITAILALLRRDPPPSLLCIEEVENGLDPWSVRRIVAKLRDASQQSTQVVITTHSPWLLNDIPMDEIHIVRRVGGDTEYTRFTDDEQAMSYRADVPAGTRYANIEGY